MQDMRLLEVLVMGQEEGIWIVLGPGDAWGAEAEFHFYLQD